MNLNRLMALTTQSSKRLNRRAIVLNPLHFSFRVAGPVLGVVNSFLENPTEDIKHFDGSTKVSCRLTSLWRDLRTMSFTSVTDGHNRSGPSCPEWGLDVFVVEVKLFQEATKYTCYSKLLESRCRHQEFQTVQSSNGSLNHFSNPDIQRIIERRIDHCVTQSSGVRKGICLPVPI